MNPRWSFAKLREAQKELNKQLADPRYSPKELAAIAHMLDNVNSALLEKLK